MNPSPRTIHSALTTAAHALVDPQPSPEARMKLAQGLLTLAAMIEDVAAGKIGALQLLEAEGIIPGTEPHGRFRRQVTRHAGLNATYATIVEFDMRSSSPKGDSANEDSHRAQAARRAIAPTKPSPKGDSARENPPIPPTHDCDPGDCA